MKKPLRANKRKHGAKVAKPFYPMREMGRLVSEMADQNDRALECVRKSFMALLSAATVTEELGNKKAGAFYAKQAEECRILMAALVPTPAGYPKRHETAKSRKAIKAIKARRTPIT